MDEIHILESKHLKNLSREEQLELATRTLCEPASEFATAAHEFRVLASEFRALLKSEARILVERDRQRWERDLLEGIKSESTGEISGLESLDATKRVAR